MFFKGGPALARFETVVRDLPLRSNADRTSSPGYRIFSSAQAIARQRCQPVRDPVTKIDLSKVILVQGPSVFLGRRSLEETQYAHIYYHAKIAELALAGSSGLRQDDLGQIRSAAGWLDHLHFLDLWSSHYLDPNGEPGHFLGRRVKDAGALAAEAYSRIATADITKRNRLLGQVIHLLTDMGTPAHVLGLSHQGDSLGKIGNRIWPRYREDDYESYWNHADNIENKLPGFVIEDIAYPDDAKLDEIFRDLAEVSWQSVHLHPFEINDLIYDQQVFRDFSMPQGIFAYSEKGFLSRPERYSEEEYGAYFRVLTPTMIWALSLILMPITLGVVRGFWNWHLAQQKNQ